MLSGPLPNLKALLSRQVLLLLLVAACSGPSTSQRPCDEVACGENGQCVTDGQSPQCACNPGYRAEGLSCVEDQPVTPCEPSPCKVAGRTLCVVVDGTSARCDCEAGKREQEGACVSFNPCQPNPC